MAEIDTSIYSKLAPQPQADPLAMAGKVIGLQSGIQGLQTQGLNNQLLGQTVQGKQALGQIIGRNTDQGTGEVDWKKVSADASADPNAAILMPEIQKQVIDREIQKQNLAGVTLDVQAKRQKAIADAVSPLLDKGDDVTPKDVKDALTNTLIKSGYFSDEPSILQLANLSQQVDGMKGPELKTLLQHYGQTADMTLGRIQTQFAQSNGGMTPSEYNTQTTLPVKDAKGNWVPTQRRLGDVVRLEQGGSPIQTGPGATAEGVPLAEAGKPAYSVQTPTGSPGMVTTGEAARAAAGGAAPQVTPTGPAPGTAEATAATAGANAARGVQIQHLALTAAPRLVAMRDVKSLIDQVPDTAFGPTSDITAKVGKIASAFGLAGPKTVNGQAGFDEMNKALSLIAAQQGQEMGAGTDASRAIVHDSNPSFGNSKEGMRQNLAVVQGNDQWNVAKNRAWQEYQQTHPAADEAKFETAYNAKVSPLVFQLQNMTPTAQRRVWSTLSGTKNKDGSWTGQRGDLLKATEFAEKQGWFEGQ